LGGSRRRSKALATERKDITVLVVADGMARKIPTPSESRAYPVVPIQSGLYGVGGLASGEMASKIAVETILEFCKKGKIKSTKD
jgi:hypothetical protein